MQKHITGIHHITAMADDAQKNLDFYAGVLGLRFIKKTVNFDAPDVYHFYYGDEQGSPGSVLTFFPFKGSRRGRHGVGFVNTTSFSVPLSALGYWEQRLKRFGIPYKDAQERFGDEVFIYFEDHDGLGLELVFSERDKREPYSGGPVPAEFAIRGFFNAEIWTDGSELTAALLTTQMDHTLVAERGNRLRFAATDKPGHYIDLLMPRNAMRGLGGSGTVHHIAFCTPDEASQLIVRDRIGAYALNPTGVIDRQYFKSIYFREPGGVLFEVATDGPGFTIDEPLQQLGEKLMLPPQYEAMRDQIIENLMPIKFRQENF